MNTKIELAKLRDFGEIINDTIAFVRQNFKPLMRFFFIFCGFFLLATAATSVLLQMKSLKTMRDVSTFLTPTYFLTLFFSMLEYIAITITVLCYMAIYKQNQNQIPTADEMWGYFKFYFLKTLGSYIIVALLLGVALLFCLIPGLYLLPMMALIFPIMVIENTSFGYAFNHSFRLIKGSWWPTFGALVAVVIIVRTAQGILSLPATLLTLGKLFLNLNLDATTSITLIIITSVLQVFSHVFEILIIVATCLCYFNLTENKEGTGMLERINQFGNADLNSKKESEEY